jgi:excisionase family DNA binding protein
VTDRLLSLTEAADHLGLRPPTLYRWRAEGGSEYPSSFRVGNRVKYRLSELDAWLEAQEQAEADRVAARIAG